jgi:hypothetical protein
VEESGTEETQGTRITEVDPGDPLVFCISNKRSPKQNDAAIALVEELGLPLPARPPASSVERNCHVFCSLCGSQCTHELSLTQHVLGWRVHLANVKKHARMLTKEENSGETLQRLLEIAVGTAAALVDQADRANAVQQAQDAVRLGVEQGEGDLSTMRSHQAAGRRASYLLAGAERPGRTTPATRARMAVAEREREALVKAIEKGAKRRARAQPTQEAPARDMSPRKQRMQKEIDDLRRQLAGRAPTTKRKEDSSLKRSLLSSGIRGEKVGAFLKNIQDNPGPGLSPSPPKKSKSKTTGAEESGDDQGRGGKEDARPEEREKDNPGGGSGGCGEDRGKSKRNKNGGKEKRREKKSGEDPDAAREKERREPKKRSRKGKSPTPKKRLAGEMDAASREREVRVSATAASGDGAGREPWSNPASIFEPAPPVYPDAANGGSDQPQWQPQAGSNLQAGRFGANIYPGGWGSGLYHATPPQQPWMYGTAAQVRPHGANPADIRGAHETAGWAPNAHGHGYYAPYGGLPQGNRGQAPPPPPPPPPRPCPSRGHG